MAHKEELDQIPAADVDQVVQDYKDSGATSVEKTQQADGTYTVIATFP